MNNSIRFIVNNSVVEASVKTSLSGGVVLLDFLRKDQGLTGTKEVCKEGDCGACTVLLGEKLAEKIIYKSIASCLTPIGDVRGKHIVTIEGINKENGLTPVQDEFLKEGASQCGFCTPGFIIALTNFFINSSNLSYQDAIDAMDGNICRCTGYMSIKRAAKNLTDKYGKMLDKTKDRIKQLTEWEILPDYFNSVSDKLNEISTSEITYKKGRTLVAGGTDLFVQRADSLLEEELEFTGKDKSLFFINEKDGKIIIGGNTTVTDLRDSSIIKKYFPGFKETTNLISSTIIRNRASVSGNFVNASPIGDISIIMLALNAELTITTGKNNRKIFLKNFYSGYKTFDLKKEEYIREISFDAPDKNTKFNFEKVSKRKYLDIASANSAILIKTIGEKIEDIKVSGGGVWPFPLFLSKTSEFLKGKELTANTIKKAAKVLISEIAPIDDVRGKAEYKSLLLRQLFYAHFITLYPQNIKMEDLV